MDSAVDAATDVAALIQRFGRAEQATATDEQVTMSFTGGHEVTMNVAVVSTATADHGQAMEGRPIIVVADRISEGVRRTYENDDVSWWDRRGHLRLVSGPVLIDTDVPAETRPRVSAAVNPLGGSVVAGVSLIALAVFPDPIPGVRALARELDASPGGVSLAIRRLTDAGLLTVNHVAARPGLFWAVSDRWRPDWTTIDGTPPPADGLVAVGSLAAAELGAPLAVTDDAPLELLAADRTTFRLAVRTATGDRSTRLALAPTAAISQFHHETVTTANHPCANPAVVAALLGADPGRGAEIVEEWEMPNRAW